MLSSTDDEERKKKDAGFAPLEDDRRTITFVVQNGIEVTFLKPNMNPPQRPMALDQDLLDLSQSLLVHYEESELAMVEPMDSQKPWSADHPEAGDRDAQWRPMMVEDNGRWCLRRCLFLPFGKA
ncbi:hypothetical protein KKC88_06390 [Patescibacteria group bacterium]|nr:hypothetical protein [Patescibacteria group bacterium]MBU1673889.1 hypothetical protein [Patescibacteria group bacterium]MBU1963438.1 hypothetical protein [Patescibacteria group bacterium]